MATARLSHEQAQLLNLFAAAYEEPDGRTGQKETLMFTTAMGGAGTRVQHHGLPDGVVRVALGDLEELADYGLISITYGSRGTTSGSFRVTRAGYDAVDQIRQQEEALAGGGHVTPAEAKTMGLDWSMQVWPVLQAVYDLFSESSGSRGVSQDAINERLGREKSDPATSRVLRKLEEADLVIKTIGVDQVEGPLFCEPSPKALELVAGWPTERGDVALARFVDLLEKRIEATADPEEQGKLRRVLASLQDVGEGVMAGILTKMMTGEG